MTKEQELKIAVKIAYECTDHINDSGPTPLAFTARYEALLKAVYDRLACDLGKTRANALFAKVVEDQNQTNNLKPYRVDEDS